MDDWDKPVDLQGLELNDDDFLLENCEEILLENESLPSLSPLSKEPPCVLKETILEPIQKKTILESIIKEPIGPLLETNLRTNDICTPKKEPISKLMFPSKRLNVFNLSPKDSRNVTPNRTIKKPVTPSRIPKPTTPTSRQLGQKIHAEEDFTRLKFMKLALSPKHDQNSVNRKPSRLALPKRSKLPNLSFQCPSSNFDFEYKQ